MSKRDELRAKLKKSTERQFRNVDVPGGETYTIRSLSMKEKGENEMIPVNTKTASIDTGKINRQKCDLLCRSVVDDDHQPLFGEDEWEFWLDVASPVASKLLAEIEKLNEGESVTALVGNSGPTGD